MPDEGVAIPELIVLDVVQAAVDQLTKATADTATAGDQALLAFLIAGRPTAEQNMFYTALKNRGPGAVRLALGSEPIEDWQVTVMLQHVPKIRGTLGDVVGNVREEPLAVRQLAADLGAGDTGPLSLSGGALPVGMPSRGRCRLGPDDPESERAIYHVDGAGVVTLPYRGVVDTVPQPLVAGADITFHTLTQLIGYFRRAVIRVDIIASNPLFVVLLGTALAMFILARRDAFEFQGMTLEDIDETDMAPRPPLWPMAFAARTITLTFDFNVGVPEDLGVVTDTGASLTTEGLDDVRRIPQFG